MSDALPLVIFENGKLIYSNSKTEKIFDYYSFTLKGLPYKQLFNNATVLKLENLNEDTETEITTSNGDTYNARLSKCFNLIIIRFISPVGEIPKTISNIRLDNTTLFEHIMNYYKSYFDNLIDKIPKNTKIEKVNLKLNNFFDDITDYFEEIKNSQTANFEVFNLCSVINSVASENVKITSSVNNGFVYGDRNKLVSLISDLLKEGNNLEINLTEQTNSISVSIAMFNDNMEFSEEIAPVNNFNELAKSAGCSLYDYFVPKKGRRIVVMYDVSNAYRAFEGRKMKI